MQAKAFKSVPVLALTATATDKVKEDVTKILRISGCPCLQCAKPSTATALMY